MLRKILFLAFAAMLVLLATYSLAQAWGGFHYSYHYGPYGGFHYRYHYGGYPGYGGFHGYGYRGYPGYGGFYGYHYGGYGLGDGYRYGYYRRW